MWETLARRSARNVAIVKWILIERLANTICSSPTAPYYLSVFKSMRPILDFPYLNLT